MVRLIPMTEEDFQRWREPKIRQYALDKAQAGNWGVAEAQRMSEQSFHQLLPEGLATPHQHLLTIEDPDPATKVGFLWFAVNMQGPRPVAFLYDLIIFEEFRRRGYAAQALQQLEASVQALGLDTLTLHVFGHNQAARQLYETLGYVATNINMSKKLSASGKSNE